MLALLAAAALASPQGQVWIVDSTGAPGTDFTTVQPAIDAASDGDVVLVRALSADPGFTLIGKALVITAQDGLEATTGPMVVAAIPAGRSASVRGFAPASLEISDCEGAVLAERIGSGTAFPFPCWGMFGTAAPITVASCADVVLARCSAAGLFGETPGIRILDSSVALYDVQSVGSSQGYDGGDGLHVAGGSFALIAGGRIAGGCGQDDVICIGSGKAGNGVTVETGSHATLLDVELIPGLDGFSVCFPAGEGKHIQGPYQLLAGHARGYAISATASGGTVARIEYAGVAGDLVLSLIGLGVAPAYLPQHAGTLVPSQPLLLIVHGPAPAGTLAIDVALPTLPPGLEALPVVVQGAAISPVGAAVLAAPSRLVIL